MSTENVTGQNDSAEFDAAFKEFAGDPQPGADAAKAGSDKEPAKAAEEAKPGDQTSETPAGKASTETPGSEATPEAGKDGDKPSPDATKETQGADDIDWSQVPEGLRTKLQTEIQEIRSNRGRMRHQERELNRLRGKVAVYEKSGKDASTASPGKDSGKDTEEGKKAAAEQERLRKEYPEVAAITAPLEKKIGELETTNQKLEAELGGISEERRQDNLDTQWKHLIEREPHAALIAGSEPFKKWVAEQPASIQEGVRRNHGEVVDGNEAAKIIKLFRIETDWKPPEPASGGKDPTKTKRERQLQSSTDVPGKGPGTASGAPDDFERAFDHYAKQPAK